MVATAGFDDQKVSKDSAIKVDWAPSSAPITVVLEPPQRPLLEEDGVLKEKSKSRKPKFR